MKHQFLFTFLFFIINISYAQIQIGKDINGEFANDQSGHSVSISAEGNRVAIGAFNNGNGNGSASGHTRVYEELNGNWIQIGQDIDGEMQNDWSGYTVSLTSDGKRVAIGAVRNNGNGAAAGHVRVYEEVNRTWVQVGQDIDGEAAGDWFGGGVSISADGKRIAIGARENDGNGTGSGHVRVFKELNGDWNQVGQDIDGEAPGDRSGTEVSISSNGKRVAIGAHLNDGNGTESGQVRVYEELNGNWIQIGQDLDGEAARDWFGYGVSLSSDGTKMAIGALFNGGNGFYAGHTRVYEELNGNWIQIGQDIDGEAPFDRSGTSVSLSGNGKRVAIGASENAVNGANSGHVRIYEESNGNWIQSWEDIDGGIGDQIGESVSFSTDGKRVAIGANGNNFYTGLAKIYKLNGTFGKIFLDINQDCFLDQLEQGQENIRVLVNPGNYVAETNSKGIWNIDLPSGNYSIYIDTTKQWKTVCPLPQLFMVIHPDSTTIAPSIGIYSAEACPAPNVSIYMPTMRPCFTDQLIFVQACNTSLAAETLYNVSAIVTLDSLIIPTSFELPNTNLGNNQYEFDLDSLEVGQCVNFWIKATVDCSITSGQALCMEAELFPQEACVFDSIPNPFPSIVQPCPGVWDGSSLKVEGYCNNGNINFDITNIGTGNMTCYSPITIYIDGMLHLIDSVKLDTQQVMLFSFTGNGESWHLDVDQHPNHPGNSQPKATLENCGGTTNQTMINLFAQDDADPIIDIYCGEVVGSYTPNSKIGYPIGLTQNHYIPPNQQLQYRIRFQNTGTDTVFTVVIRDTLDTNLDIFSVQSGVASHPYNFRMYGQRVLEWTFIDIMLPDSNINEPASHGFVFFTVDQLPNLPDGTLITNSAGIYLDFNTPTLTNTTQHEINSNFPEPSDVEEIKNSNQFTLYPNPNDGQFFIDLKEEYAQVELTLTDITGRIIATNEYQGVSGIPMKIEDGAGIYLVKVRVDGVHASSNFEVFKVVKY